MITLYEVLEVSEKASDEVIEKAYKILAKRYHPDLQQPEDRKKAEEKMKQINDAYDTLSNTKKREEYDAGLKRIREREELEKARQYIKQNAREESQETRNYTNNTVYRQNVTRQAPVYYQYQTYTSDSNMQKEYWKKKLISFRDGAIAIAVIISIIFLLWLVPPTHDMMVKFYEENMIFKLIIDTFTSMWN